MCLGDFTRAEASGFQISHRGFQYFVEASFGSVYLASRTFFFLVPKHLSECRQLTPGSARVESYFAQSQVKPLAVKAGAVTRQCRGSILRVISGKRIYTAMLNLRAHAKRIEQQTLQAAE